MSDLVPESITYIFSQNPRSILSYFLRFIYPGVIIFLFIYWRYNQIIDSWMIKAPINIAIGLVASLTLGIVTYYIHRAFFHPIVTLIEIPIGAIPQYKLFRQFADELKLPKEVVGFRIVQGCIAEVENKLLTPDEKKELWFNNSPVHALLMTALISLGALVHDVAKMSLNTLWVKVWLLIFLIFIALGIFIDAHLANERETQMLLRHRKDCKKFFRERASLEAGSIGSPKRPIT